jgi:hypothetical protein
MEAGSEQRAFSVPGTAQANDGGVMSQDDIGQHATGFEEPDTIWLRLVGAVNEEEGRVINDFNVSYGKGRQHIFFLVDLAGLESIDPVARREAAVAMQQLPLCGVAIHGASLKAKVLAKLVFTAINLFRRTSEASVPIHFFDTADEARAWIHRRRADLQSAA